MERYGLQARAQWRIVNLRFEPTRTCWTVLKGGEPWADFEFGLAGEYNVCNATAAAAMAAGCGISTEKIQAALKTFKSVKRRLEVKAQVNGITIIDDFAHHPTAIAGTLTALRSRFPGARLWVILEPRSNTLRRNVFQHELANSLGLADEVIVAVGAELQQRGKRARIISGADGIVAVVAPELRSGDVVAILSNGGFEGIYQKLPARLKEIGGSRGKSPLEASAKA